MTWEVEARAHAAEEFPRESCGLLVASPFGPEYWPCRNIAHGDDEFVIDPQQIAQAEDDGLDVVGVVHSHPGQSRPRPSAADLRACDAGAVPWHIIGWPGGEVISVQPRASIAPLQGRVFEHGRADCYTAVRDWYRIERGVWLPDYPREDGWWAAGGNLYLEQFGDAGFVEVACDPEPGDVLLMQIRSPVPNHAGIYMARDRILHHLGGRLSCVEAWGGALRATTKKVLRYAPA